MSVNTNNVYAKPDSLVDTDWLVANLGDPKLRIVEVDEDTDAYTRSHIPGAIAWDWSKDLHHPIRRDYLDRGGLEDLLSRSGVDSDTTVILYGGNNNWFAAYAYWLLKLRGFDSVKLLDGGRLKWNVEERETTSDVPSIEKTSFQISGAGRPELRALRDEVLQRVADGETTFVDVRSPEEFSGAKLAPDHLPQEQPYVGGHVPGAKSIPWSKAANEDGSFRSAAELAELYGGAGVDGSSEIVAYCRIGERSSHTWFVLHELLGYDNVSNYDGSWTEYGSLVGAPVER
ncbi:MAG TPA: sulfurtransferase [Acidimicrobiia bacterium]|jgi:thiosulfate/3-mercaptopyruvate sulfurtransferase|nr:sulfurtransferase [Acidimicrobiia bacterium]